MSYNNILNKEVKLKVTPDDFSSAIADGEHVKEAITKIANKNKFTIEGYEPSNFLPARTATFWQDVLVARLPKINFFKTLKNGKNEIHDNGTKLWERLISNSILLDVLRETEYELSLDGESDIAIFKQGKDIVPLKIDLIKKDYFPNGELMFYQGLVNMNQGTAPWIMTKKFYYNNLGEVIMENVPYFEELTEDGLLEWVNISIEKFNEKYKTNIVDKVNFGRVEFPVITMTNTGNDRNGSGQSDTANLTDILKRLDIIENAIDAAMAASKTRIYKEKANGSMKLSSTPNRDNDVQQLDADTDVIELVTDPRSPNGKMQITDRQLNAQQWYDLKKSYLNDYYSQTGESVQSDAHGNNQHTYEIQSKGDNKYRRGTAKKTQRVMEIQQLVKIIISIAKQIGYQGFAGIDKVSVSFDEADIRKEYDIENRVKVLKDMNLISDIQAIKMLMNLDDLQAELFLSEKNGHEKLEDKDEKTNQIQPTMPIDGMADNDPTSIQVEKNDDDNEEVE